MFTRELQLSTSCNPRILQIPGMFGWKGFPMEGRLRANMLWDSIVRYKTERGSLGSKTGYPRLSFVHALDLCAPVL